MKKRIIIWFLGILLPYFSYSTHIVGGVLNYAYNGNNVYTITLKLYRDCGSSAAAFPSSVTIKVKGNNGANFSTSKDITINLGTVTTLSANLAPCAQAPNPMPCVQQGIYTKTVSLPPNTGGYHLYYQVSARNLSLTNINGACNCIGESFYAFIPDNTNPANSNSNAVFNLFPPLFVCVNQPFLFNHAATDADGDSLAYSLYTPYEDNTAPTFSNNIATFPTVTFLPGYTQNNPLGASPFNLNPITGVLTATPGTIGQFVVGVVVKEYRNGVLISQTLRDFQFNVLNCPAPPPTLAISNMTINNGCAVGINATGITAASSSWNSIYPGTPGAYNNYISCTSNCLNPTISAVGSGTPPPYIDFVVCGIATNCLANNICDTFRVHFNPPLSVSVAPGNQALCNGQTSATLIAIGSGGTPPYTYLWNNVNPSQTISVGAGTYNIKLSDGSGCPPAYSSAVVTSYSVPVNINAGADKTVCITNPGTSHTATISGAGGCIWSGGTGTFSPNNTTSSNVFYTPTAAELAAGSVTLIVTTTGSGACPSATDAVVITYMNFTGTVSTSTVAVSCYGGNNGSASVSVSGGMTPYTYTWNTVPSQNTALAGTLAMGFYSVSIKDAIGCINQQTVAIPQPSPIAVNATLTNVSCFAGNNGSISVSALGGTSPYSYSWAPGAITTTTLASLSAGTYSLKVTDAKACVYTTTYAITQPASLTIAFTSTNISCYNGSNGVINSTINGGTTPYSYSWSPGGASSSNISGLIAGTYTLLVKDNLNCSSTKTVTLTQPPLLTISATFTNETCNYLNNGIINATANGGTPGYTYACQPGGYTVANISNLASGSYTVNVTDAKACQTNTVITISEPAALIVNLINPNNVSCFGGNNGSVTANVSGGTAGYTYSWSPGTNSAGTYSNLTAGTYSVFVTDSKSCTSTNSITITQPNSLSLTVVQTSVSCYGGSNGTSSVSAQGGTSPYSYFWMPLGQSTDFISNLIAGTYTAQATDAKGCTGTITSVVTQASPLNIAFTSTNVSCFNGSNASIAANVSGGNAPYSYTWNPVTANTASVSGLSAGNYTLNISDLYNCTASKTISITQPSVLLASTTVTNETCDYLNNGKANVSATGGTGPYTYTWQPGALTGSAVTNLAAGIYSVTATDSKGCTTLTTAVIAEPATLSVAITSTVSPSCFGGNNGSASAAGVGGTANYSYTWSPGAVVSANINNIGQGTYTVNISDSKGCLAQNTVSITQPASITISNTISTVSCFGGNNGAINLGINGGTSPFTYFWLPGGQSGSSVTNLTSGNYTVNVTDANGCSKTASFFVAQNPSITIALTSTQVTCFNGSNGKINSTVSGGTSPYSYLWNPSSLNTQNISGVTAGIYTLVVTDNLACTSSKTINLTQAPALMISTSFTNESCDYSNDGKASALASGGTAGYTYTWQPGAIAASSANGLSSGTYTVFVTDIAGCTTNTTVSISEPLPLTLSFTNVVNPTCNGFNNGSATAYANGGTANYTYTWSPGATVGATKTNLALGIYTVFVKDSKACLAQNTLSISEPAPLNLVSSISNVVCNGGSNGAVSISMSGGTIPYSHNLMPGNISGVNFTNLLPGTYSIITTDANACVHTATVAINEPINISTSTSFTDAACSSQNGVASISVTSGGTPPFTYNWLPSGGTSSVSTNLYAGTYSIAVTDALGCISTKVVNINNIGAPVVSILSTTNVTCPGGNNGAINANATGVNGPFTYSWIPSGGAGLTASNLTSGIYVLQVTDNTGCVGLATSPMITQPSPIVAAVFTTAVNCFGGNDGTANTSVSGGTSGYTFSWTPGGMTTNSVSGLTANNYTLEITDAHACPQTLTFAISQPSAPLSVASTVYSVSCFAGTNGSLSSVANGGTAPYSFTVTPGNFGGQTISNLSAGTYTILANDFNACAANTTVSVIEPTAIILTPTSINSDCSLANGQVSVSATGGIGAFNYTWSPLGITGNSMSNLLAGTYSVTVADANNCIAATSLTLNDNPAPLVSVTSVTNVSCFNGNDGAAFANVSGGTGPFSYAWMPTGGTTSTGSNLTVGNYSVLVTSANACTVLVAGPAITEPSQTFISLSLTAVSCFGSSTGSATATVNGGTPAHTFVWENNASVINTASAYPSGNYTVQTTDANNCINTQSFAITQPTAALSLSFTAADVTCFGGSNGSVIATVAGGTAPYNFNWFPGNYTGASLSNLPAGIYTVVVTDIKLCNISATVSIAEPTAINLSINPTNSDCSLANGMLSVAASGGTGAFTYTWLPSGGNTSNASNLMAGTYSLFVLDANNCPSNTTATVIDNPAPMVSVSSVSAVTCFGGSNGLAEAAVTGGTGPFAYNWLPAGGSASVTTGVSAGSYSVLVTSANACTVLSTASVITEPSAISSNILTTSVTCFGNSNGSATLMIGGGTPSYTCTLPSGAPTNTIINNLAAGIYSLTVSDANLCPKTVSFQITEPLAPLTLTLGGTINVSCFGGNNGSATILASGGTPAFSYNWLPYGGSSSIAPGLIAGTYTVIVNDANACSTSTTVTVSQPAQALSATSTSIDVTCFGGANGSATVTAAGGTPGYSYLWTSSAGTASVATGLSMGNYSVLVKDFNNCQTNISVHIDQPSAVAGTIISTNAACALSNGAMSSQITGGTGPYTTLWQPGSYTTSAISNLSPGTYTLEINDAFNCVKTLTTTLINIPGPSINNMTTKAVSCFSGNNGSSTITINQGTAPFNISWLPYGGNSTTGTNLIAGTYTVNVIDALGCAATRTATITEPTLLNVSVLSIKNVSCFGGDNGAISVQAIGGTPNYTYNWSPTHTGSTINNLLSGNYTLTVKDAQNCTLTVAAQVPQPPALVSSITNVEDALCFHGPGSASLSASGGEAPYTYTWTSNPVQYNSILLNVTSGSYTATIKDFNNCLSTTTVIIKEPTQVITSVLAKDTMCVGQNSNLIATAKGGSGNYYYTWMPGAITNSGTLSINPTSSVTYTVLAFDNNGCSGKDAQSEIKVYNLTRADLDLEGLDLICPGMSTMLEADVHGDNGPLVFSWNQNLPPISGVHVVSPKVNTEYIVTVTNACGTTIKDTLDVKINDLPIVQFTADTLQTCVQGQINFKDLSVPINTNDPLISWTWDFGDGTFGGEQNPIHTFTEAGTYVVDLEVTTDRGCSNKNTKAPLVVIIHPQPFADFLLNADTLNLPYDALICTNTSTGAVNYLWNFGAEGTSTQVNPKINLQNLNDHNIQLIAYSQFGCSDTTQKTVHTKADIIFPNAFTPSEHGSSGGAYDETSLNNDVFFPYTSGVIEYKLQIFNRWGELIFESTDVKKGWDGYYRDKICQVGVYIWKAHVVLQTGKTFDHTGNLSLIR